MWSPVLLNVPHLPSHASAIISLFVGTLKYSVCKCNYTGTYTQSCLWSNLCRNFTVFYLLKHLWQWKFFGFLFFLIFFFMSNLKYWVCCHNQQYLSSWWRVSSSDLLTCRRRGLRDNVQQDRHSLCSVDEELAALTEPCCYYSVLT